MKKIIAALIAVSMAGTINARISRVSDYTDIARYVESEAAPTSPRAMTFTDGDNSYLQLNEERTAIEKFDTKSGKAIETVFKADYTRESTVSSIEGFTVSPNGMYMLVWTNSESQYRHSFTAEYYVYEFRTRILQPLSTERPRQQAPIFSPDGRMVAYAADNNIYIKKVDYGTDIPVTTDGKVNEVINGIPDWTYQEEFATTRSMTWAPDNLTLCYLKYNEKEVPLYSFPLYEGDCPAMSQYALYPGAFTYKYPVAGERNSTVTLHSYNIETRKTLNLQLPDGKIEYIPRIMYGPTAEQLLAVSLNREQNRMEVFSVNPKSNVAKSLLVETSNAWIAPESYEDITLLPDFFVIASSRTGYQHYYRYAYTGALLGAITTGDYDVTKYYGYNAATGCHFFQSTAEGAVNRTIYRLDRKGVKTAISPLKGYSNATFGPACNNYVLSHSDITTPTVYTINAAATGKAIRTLVDNKTYAAKYANAPKAELFTMQSDGNTLNGYIIKPANFDPSKRYPVVMSQYSGPGSQEVLNRWTMNWANYFATQGYVVISVDGRGTGGRGRAFMDVVYKRLGHYESIDQVAAARYAASLPFVDPNRIGIYGWSYGGYETIMASSQKDAPYAAAVAVAPVTDWRFYDTVYAERYMQTPQMNESGYREASAITIAADRKCPLLIISGTADDNVHFYNTLHYMTKLESMGMWIDMMAVPNANHFITGCGKRSLVYARMLDYFNNNMK